MVTSYPGRVERRTGSNDPGAPRFGGSPARDTTVIDYTAAQLHTQHMNFDGTTVGEVFGIFTRLARGREALEEARMAADQPRVERILAGIAKLEAQVAPYCQPVEVQEPEPVCDADLYRNHPWMLAAPFNRPCGKCGRDSISAVGFVPTCGRQTS